MIFELLDLSDKKHFDVLQDLATVDMEDLRHTGSSIMGFTILNAKNYREAKSSGELSQVRNGPKRLFNEVLLKPKFQMWLI